MRKSALILILLALLALPAWPQTAGTEKTPEEKKAELERRYANMPPEAVPFRRFSKPYYEWFVEKNTLEYFGAASDRPDGDINKLSEVAIGFLGPIENNPESIFGIPSLHAAQMAIEEANSRGGYKGKPYALKVYNDSALWGASSTVLPSMLFKDNCWAVLGSIDGQSTHIMIRVSLKLEVPILSSGATDRTVPETRIQWLMQTFPNDRQQGYALAEYIFNKLNLKRIGVLRTQTRYARIGVGVFSDMARRTGRQPILEVKFDRGDTDYARQLKMLQDAKIDALVIWGEYPEAGLILKQMRAMGMKQPVFGSSRTAYPQLLEIAGPAAEGYVAACGMDPERQDPQWTAFRDRYRQQYKEDPDPYAAHAYDGVRILIAAIEKTGLNRGRIMEVLRNYQQKPFEGVAGHYAFDYTLNNVAPVTLGRVEGGKFVYWTAPPHAPDQPVVAESR
ncbi:MAG: ABC transporter substrate-binding protein [Acidobacteriia bacterium]|nr:ABC transporter substrate-binding protein [Terriglobia bacterium]